MGVIKNKYTKSILISLEKIIYKYATHIVALSPGMVAGILKREIPNQKVSMIPNSCDLELFNSNNSKSDFFKEEFSLSNKFVVIHPGSMGKANGLMYILKAANELEKSGNKDVIILLTGDGLTRPLLEDYCKKHGITNVLFTGSIAKKEMPNLIAASDITITSFLNIPILATNSPNKFFDSLAAGKPVIVNSDGWTKDIVINEEIGFYVDPEDPKVLSNLLDKLSKDKYVLKGMGLRAREVAEKEFDRNKLAIQLENILLKSVK